MDFTSAQKKAIDTRNCSLLVAAGAGSGKTRVLTERIIDRILDTSNGTDITDFLIVTFTKAAAEEMSDRIRRALTERSVEFPENKKLIRNIALLPQARISTISSFCLDIVKENYQKLGLPPKLRVAEDAELAVILDRIIDGIVEEKLTSPDESEYFTTLYENFAGKKSDGPFADTLKVYYKALTNLPSMTSYLDSACCFYKEVAECHEIFDTTYGSLIRDFTKKDLLNARRIMCAVYEDSKKEPDTFEVAGLAFENDIVAIDNILSSVEFGYEAAAYQINVFSPARKSTKKHLSKDYTDSLYERASVARDTVKKELKNDFYSVNSDVYKACALDYYNIMKELSAIMLEIDRRFSDEKRTKGILSFSDAERYALKLLYDDVDSETVSADAKSISDSIAELYIDEYQDINPIQDMIFKAISKKNDDGCEENRFLVGDSKQSIYGFRGARPDIFNGYRASFADADDATASARRLFMQNNFRCSENVIDFTNMLFEKIMPEEYGEADKLIYSKHEDFKTDAPVKLIYCNTDEADFDAEDRLTVQADAVYGEILGLTENSDKVKCDGTRYTLDDMAILTREWKEAVFLERYFSEKGIPVVCEKGESYFDRDEVKLALNIIRSVDNPERNISTAGFMRSGAGGFSDDDLAAIRHKVRDGSLFSAVKKYVFLDDADEGISQKISRFLQLHSELRTQSRICNASDFIRKMYKSTDLVNICTKRTFFAEGEAVSAQASMICKKNLLTLYDIARDFDSTVFKGISAFIEYIDAKAADAGLKSASLSGDGIRIMTIHRSKGLEFPVCILFGCDKVSRHASDRLIMNEKYGSSFKLKSLEKIKSVQGIHGFVTTDTPFRKLIKRLSDASEHLEDKRLLYVALTRAKERLIITASPKPVKNFEGNLKQNLPYYITEGKSQLSLILSFLYGEKNEFSVERADVYTFCKDDGRPVLEAEVRIYSDIEDSDVSEEKTVTQEHIYQPDGELLEKIKQRIAAGEAARKSISTIPPKLTVSLLKHGLIDYEEAEYASETQRNPLDMPEFIRASAQNTGAEKGTAMHTFLQFADFDGCVSDGCEREAQRLAKEGFITERQKEMLDISKLNGFFKTKLYSDISKAVKVHRELRFNLSARAGEVIANVPDTSDFVLIQGVIDCFTENADGSYTVIDFKTDNVKAENAAEILTERYKNQLAFYCRAVEDITKKKVSKAVIFSFANMETIELDVDTLKFG